jgi:hypothetical protein
MNALKLGIFLRRPYCKSESRSNYRQRNQPAVRRAISRANGEGRTNRVCFRPTAVRCRGWSRFTTAENVGGLFFPRTAELGLAVEDTASPRVLAKMVYSGTSAASFAEASKDLQHVGDLSVSDERVRRACGHVGSDRIDQHRALQEAFQCKPLPEQSRGKPVEVTAPEIACVMADGGRYQHLDRQAIVSPPAVASARKGEHWKESRIGLLACMRGERYEDDPQPKLPPELRYEAMADTLSEMGKTGKKLEQTEDVAEEESSTQAADDGLVGPTLDKRSVVASRRSWEDFGPLLASQAWYRGFAAAERKVFVSDGSSSIEKMQQAHFSHYTSVLDILHALSYCLAAARAVCDNENAARKKYDFWAAKIWEGNVDDVIDELIVYQRKIGEPPPDAGSEDPREVIRTSRVYYENHAYRMDYPKYRREGFPLTSSLMESTVKQVSRRVKGSEKYWSSAGGEAMLRLRGEYLSDDDPMSDYWENRSRNATGTRAYRSAPEPVYN